MRLNYHFVVALLTSLLAACSQSSPLPTAAPPLAPQFGTPQTDASTALAVSPLQGAIFVGGTTQGALDADYRGSVDAFLRRYSRSGKLLWRAQFGGADTDTVDALATDLQGNVFLTGQTGNQPFLRKYSAAGDLLWARRINLPANPSVFKATVVVTPASNAFVVGDLYGDGLFVAKFGAAGAQLWLKNYTASLGTFSAAQLYKEQLYLMSSTQNQDNHQLSVLNLAGKVLRRRVLDTGAATDQDTLGVATMQVGPYGIYLAGSKWWFYQNVDTTDVYVAHFNLQGDKLWDDIYGSPEWDVALTSTVDAAGNLYLPEDGSFRKYAPSGKLLWEKPISAPTFFAAATLAKNEVYLAGIDYHYDAFLTRYNGNGHRLWNR